MRELLISLEDRRALYVGAIWEQPEHVARSVQEMRQELTSTIKRLGDGSAAEACRAMRAACRDFQSKVDLENFHSLDRRFVEGWQGETFPIALGALRAVFGQQIATLAHLYDVDLKEHLAAILPPVSKNEGDNN